MNEERESHKKLIKIHFILLFLGYLGKGLAVNQGRILSGGPPNDSYWPGRMICLKV